MKPGRDCPLSYRYAPTVFAADPAVVAETLYVAGGLYGNIEALDALLDLAANDDGAAIVFNGDFHWFDVAPADFERVGHEVLRHHAIRGNVETEIAEEDSGAGCGCAYPMDVSDAEVSRSNEILAILRETAREFPGLRTRQGALPMHLTARVGEARIGIVHGDAAGLAGWNFAHDQLDNPKRARWLEETFAASGVDVFASSHTCLPACRRFTFASARGVVINNGAAGMPNFADSSHGIVTRISTRASPVAPLYGAKVGAVHVDALALAFDAMRWRRRFLAAWPEGSPAHLSYFRRISQGPRYSISQAAPPRREASAA